MIPYLLPFWNWNWGSPRVPALYWDVYSQEERWKKLCLQLQRIYDYMDDELTPKINSLIDAVADEEIARENADAELLAIINQHYAENNEAHNELTQLIYNVDGELRTLINQTNQTIADNEAQHEVDHNAIWRAINEETNNRIMGDDNEAIARDAADVILQGQITQLQGIGRVAANLGASPSQSDILNAWTNGTGGAPSYGATVINLDENAPWGDAYTYLIVGTTPTWVNRGTDVVNVATNTTNGILHPDDDSLTVDATGTIKIKSSWYNQAIGNGLITIKNEANTVIGDFTTNQMADETITIPNATKTQRGLVRVGDNIGVSNGVIQVDPAGETTPGVITENRIIELIGEHQIVPPATGDTVFAGMQFLAGKQTKDYGISNYIINSFSATNTLVIALSDFTWSNFWTHLEAGQLALVGGDIVGVSTDYTSISLELLLESSTYGDWGACMMFGSYNSNQVTLTPFGEGVREGTSFDRPWYNPRVLWNNKAIAPAWCNNGNPLRGTIQCVGEGRNDGKSVGNTTGSVNGYTGAIWSTATGTKYINTTSGNDPMICSGGGGGNAYLALNGTIVI